VDPISDKFPHVSTYNYAENSPVSNIDLWGLQALSANSLYSAREAIRKSGGDVNEFDKGYSTGAKVAGETALSIVGSMTQLGNYHVADNAERLGNSELAGELRSDANNAAATLFMDAVVGKGGQVLLSGIFRKGAVTIGGKSFSKSLDDIQKGYDDAGYKVVETNSDNIVYEVPTADGTGTFYSRLQQGSGKGEYGRDRVINTQNTGNTSNKQYVNPDGSRIVGPVTQDGRREIGHIYLNDKN